MGRARENGMQSVSRFTRLAVAGSLILSAVFSVIAAIGFGGHASRDGRHDHDHGGRQLLDGRAARASTER